MQINTDEIRGLARGVGMTLVLGFAAGTVCSQHMSEGIRALEAGEFTTAFRLFQSHALQGDANASYHLSEFYRTGKGVQQDEYAAYEWCRRAAEQGMAEAQFRLGIMYLEGEGVTSDEDQALNWLSAAADSGYPQAREVLDFLLYNDFTVGC